MYAPTLCAEVARRLGEPLRAIERRGFQPLRPRVRSAGPSLAAVDCPFCGQQVLVASKAGAVEAECRGCDTAFAADPGDIYEVSLRTAERPRPRRLLQRCR
jgi:hypothetical protein